MRLLLAIDETTLAQGLLERLCASGFEVCHLPGVSAEAACGQRDAFDCIVLDLSDADASRVQAWGAHAWRLNARPLLVITRAEQVKDRISLLEAGIEDLVVRPVDCDECVARVKALLRRTGAPGNGGGPGEEELRHGRLQVLPARRMVSCDGAHVSLTDMEYWVLEALLRRKGQVLTREQIEAALYGDRNDLGSNAVEVHVHHLRRKLGAELIRTVRGIGYALAG